MARQTRTESYQQEMFKVIETMACDNDGVLIDVPLPQRRPDGWITVYHQEERYGHSWDFCSYECFYGWVTAHEDGFPSKLQEQLEASVAMLTEAKA